MSDSNDGGATEGQPGPVTRVLVCVIGDTPQVVTETVYALLHENPPFVPDRIIAVTTGSDDPNCERYFDRSELNLRLDRLAGKHPDLFPLVATPLSGRLTPEFIDDRDGKRVPDIRSRDDSTAAADTLLRVLAPLCDDPTVTLHASIAGGRAAMSFYLGYLVSILGQPGARVSQVLLTDWRLENDPDFWFPNGPHWSKTHGLIQTGPESVALVDVPVVPLRPVAKELMANAATLGMQTLVERLQRASDQDRADVILDFSDRENWKWTCGGEVVSPGSRASNYERTAKVASLLLWFGRAAKAGKRISRAFWKDRKQLEEWGSAWKTVDAKGFKASLLAEALEKSADGTPAGGDLGSRLENSRDMGLSALRDYLKKHFGPAFTVTYDIAVDSESDTLGFNLRPDQITIIEPKSPEGTT